MDIQIRVSSRQLDVRVENSGEMSRLKHILNI